MTIYFQRCVSTSIANVFEIFPHKNKYIHNIHLYLYIRIYLWVSCFYNSGFLITHFTCKIVKLYSSSVGAVRVQFISTFAVRAAHFGKICYVFFKCILYRPKEIALSTLVAPIHNVPFNINPRAQKKKRGDQYSPGDIEHVKLRSSCWYDIISQSTAHNNRVTVGI